MGESKRIMISMPITLLEEVDDLICIENKNRSELIREAMRFYLEERKKSRLREELRKGYQEMAALNLSLAQEAFSYEEEASFVIKKKLVECC